MTLVSTGLLTISDVNDGLHARLSNESCTIPTDAQGSNGNYAGCVSTMGVYLGITDDSANWTVVATPSAGVAGSLSGKTYTVTALTGYDAGYVDLTASRVGYPSLTSRFAISKAKTGASDVVKEFFDGYPSAVEFGAAWIGYNGSGEITFPTSDSVTGGGVLSVGNNSGNDQQWLIGSRSFPFDPSKLYKITVVAKKTLGSGTAYFGLAGRDATDAVWVSQTGANSTSGHCYAAANAVNMPNAWTTYVGYVKGTAATGINGTPADPTAPGKLHANARYFRPLMLVNYNSAAGTTLIDSFRVEEVSGLLAAIDQITPANSGTALASDAIVASHIAADQITANHLAAITLKAGSSITAGTSADGVVLDANAKAVKVLSAGTQRVLLGYGAGAGTAYGLQVKNAAGKVLYDSTDAVYIRGDATQDNYSIGDATTGGVDGTFGYSNIAIGANALPVAHSSKVNNIAIGSGAMYLAGASSERNIAIGANALDACVSPYSVVAIGYSALTAATEPVYSTAVGSSALDACTTGSNNTAVGSRAMAYSLTTGSNNTALGNDSGQGNGSSNVNIGAAAGAAAGDYNVAVGAAAGVYSTAGSNNVMLGYGATAGSNSGNNTFVGYATGGPYISGHDNTLLGYRAGNGLTSGSYNVILGGNSGSMVAASSNNVILSDGGGNVRAQCNSVGNWGVPGAIQVGTAAPTSTPTSGVQVYSASGLTPTTTQYGVLISLTDANASASYRAFQCSGIPNAAYADSLVMGFYGSYSARIGSAVGLTYSSRYSNLATFELDPVTGYSTSSGSLNGNKFTTASSALDGSGWIQYSSYRSACALIAANVTASAAGTTVTFGSAVTLASGQLIRRSSGAILGRLASAVTNATTGTLQANASATVTAESDCISVTPAALTATVSRTAGSSAITFSVSTTLPAGATICNSVGQEVGTLLKPMVSATSGTLTSTAGAAASAASAVYCAWSVMTYSVGADVARGADAGTWKVNSNTFNAYMGGSAPSYFEYDVIVNADLNLTGTLRVAGNIYTTGVISSQDGGTMAMYPSSITGYDTQYSIVCGGGDSSTTTLTRGARAVAYGANHSSLPGYFDLIPTSGSYVRSRGALHISDQAVTDAVSTAVGLYSRFRNTGTATTQYGYLENGMCSESCTGTHYGVNSSIRGAAGAAPYTTASVINFRATDYAKGANQTVTTQYGLYVPLLAAGATNWGVYQMGAANSNYFAGRVLVGSSTDDGVNALQVTGNSKVTGALTVTGDTSTLGSVISKQAAPVAVNATATLAASSLLGCLVTTAPTANINLTLPTGTLLAAALTMMAVDQSIDWSIINTAPATYSATIVAGTGHTVVGNVTVAPSTSAMFRSRLSGANTFITYRIA